MEKINQSWLHISLDAKASHSLANYFENFSQIQANQIESVASILQQGQDAEHVIAKATFHYFVTRNAEQAFTAANQIIMSEKSSSTHLVVAYYLRAMLFGFHFMQPKLSIQDFNKVIDLCPTFDNAYLGRGSVYSQRLHDDNLAVKDYDKAIELNNKNVVALLNRGLLFAKFNQTQTALQDFQRVEELDPKNFFVHYNRAKLYYQMGKSSECIEQFNKAIELDPTNAAFYNDRGLVHAAQGNLDLALKDLNMSIELNPNNPYVYHDLGIIYLHRLNDVIKAVVNLDKAIELDADYSSAYAYRGIARGIQGLPQRALADFNKSIELNSVDNSTAFYNRALLYFNVLNDDKRSVSDFDTCIKLDPHNARLHNDRGVVRAKMNEPEKALEDFNKAIQTDRNLADAYYNRGSIYHIVAAYRNQKPLQAEHDYSKAIQLNPENPTYYIARAHLYKDVFLDEKKAAADFAKATQLNPQQAAMAQQPLLIPSKK